MSNGSTGGIVKSDLTLIDILETIQHLGGGGVTEIADAVDLPASTVHKHLKTLAQRGYVEKRDVEYTIGIKFLTFGGYALSQCQLYSRTHELIQAFAYEIDEIVTLGVLHEDRVLILLAANDRYGLLSKYYVGMDFHLHQTSEGKAILAELPDDRVNELIGEPLPKVTADTITDKRTLLGEIDRIRKRGYALTEGEAIENINAIASSVYDEESDTLGAISIFGPADRLSKERLQADYEKTLMDFTSDLELELTYH